jgi:uncharacterized protein DUF6325
LSEFDDIELGPIDYVVVEWPPGKAPDGQALPHLVDLVDRGIIRILDLAFVQVDADGGFTAIDLNDMDLDGNPELSVFEGASSGLIGEDEMAEAAGTVEAGAAAAMILFENTWAAPFATALRKSGAQLVATGRIPVNDIMQRLDELDELETAEA